MSLVDELSYACIVALKALRGSIEAQDELKEILSIHPDWSVFVTNYARQAPGEPVDEEQIRDVVGGITDPSVLSGMRHLGMAIPTFPKLVK